MTQPETKDPPFDFAAMLFPEPEWKTCDCGERSSHVPCWECDRRMAREREAQEALGQAARTFPRFYAWAHIDAPALGKRVTGCDLATTIPQVLAAQRVVFAGPSGSGKTSLAVACLRERLPDCMFVSALKLGTARIQHSAGDGEAELVARCTRTPLLLIDEVGGEVNTATNALRDVIFDRYEAGRATWITTGFTAIQLAERYGDGTVRRLLENACLVKLGGKA